MKRNSWRSSVVKNVEKQDGRFSIQFDGDEKMKKKMSHKKWTVVKQQLLTDCEFVVNRVVFSQHK